LEVKLIHAKPILGHIEVLGVGPIVNGLGHIGIRCVSKDEDVVVMEIRVCKGKQNLEISVEAAVPQWNVGRHGRDLRHGKVLGHICKEQIQACVNFRLGVHSSTACFNLESKTVENKRRRTGNRSIKS